MKKCLSALLVALALVAGGCGDDDSSTPTTEAAPTTTTTAPSQDDAAPPEDDPVLEGSITVSAAASLRDAFSELGEVFTAEHPGVEVTFNFDSSSTLSTQIIEGAPADVFASADEANMTKLADEDLVAGDAQVFARNQLVIVIKPGNPQGIGGLADLADAGIISLCGEEVPCGRYAAEVLGNAGVTIAESSVTRGQNVTATLTAVTEGDAVAAIVYATDAASAGDAVDVVEIPADVNVIATYPIGAIASSGRAEVAEAFVAFVLGDEGQAVLARHGFLPRS